MKVNRQSGVGLVEQVVAILKAQIAEGKYETGAHLPGVLEIANGLGVSEKPVRGALRRLTDEGWVRPVRGVGSVILSRSISAGNRGDVLIVYAATTASAYQSYFFATVRETLRIALMKANRRLTVAIVRSQPVDEQWRDMDELKEALSWKWDLIVESGYNRDVRAAIEASGVPFISMATGRGFLASPLAHSTFYVRMGAGLGEFYRAAARRNFRTVWQFLLGDGGFDITEALRAQGCLVRTFRRMPRPNSPYNATSCFAVSELKKVLNGGVKLPDAILFGDDYFCASGIVTILAYGYRIPEDVKIVTFSNKGNTPPFPKSLTRIELDVPDAARQMSRLVLTALKGGEVPHEVTVGSRWIPGETL